MSIPGSKFRPHISETFVLKDRRTKENDKVSPLRRSQAIEPKPFVRREGDINPNELLRSINKPESP